MPKTIEQVRVESAARVLAEHFPRADRTVCLCGSEWHPRHQAEQLLRAGCLGWSGSQPLREVEADQ